MPESPRAPGRKRQQETPPTQICGPAGATGRSLKTGVEPRKDSGVPAPTQDTEELAINRSVEAWKARLEALLPTHLNGQSPEGFEPLRRCEYVPGSVQIEEVEVDPDTALPTLMVFFRAKLVELNPQGFEIEELEGFVEIPVRLDDTLDLSQVSFQDALHELAPA
jgi:hypothetical protein